MFLQCVNLSHFDFNTNALITFEFSTPGKIDDLNKKYLEHFVNLFKKLVNAISFTF